MGDIKRHGVENWLFGIVDVSRIVEIALALKVGEEHDFAFDVRELQDALEFADPLLDGVWFGVFAQPALEYLGNFAGDETRLARVLLVVPEAVEDFIGRIVEIQARAAFIGRGQLVQFVVLECREDE